MRNTLSIIAVTAVMLGLGQAQQVTTTPISTDAKAAVLEALTGANGEYAAYATYSAVIEKFGNIEPYRSIRAAEERHILALQRLLTRYNVPIPENTYLGKISLGNDLVKVANDEAQTEIENVAMYDKLLPKVTMYPDITRVFANLRSASQNQHLPAFEAAAKNGGKLDNGVYGGGPRGGMGGPGYGQGSGPGQGFGAGPGSASGVGCPCGLNTPMGRPMGGGRGWRR
jgi:hypothetical protein